MTAVEAENDPMDDLVRWFGEQLDKDARIAHAACWDDQSDVWTARPPQASYERYTVVDYLDDGVVAVTPENADVDGVGQHIAEWDPARVLREIDADRKLIAQYSEVADNDVDEMEYAHGWAQALGLAVRLRAAVYADRPGYRDEWRP